MKINTFKMSKVSFFVIKPLIHFLVSFILLIVALEVLNRFSFFYLDPSVFNFFPTLLSFFTTSLLMAIVFSTMILLADFITRPKEARKFSENHEKLSLFTEIMIKFSYLQLVAGIAALIMVNYFFTNGTIIMNTKSLGFWMVSCILIMAMYYRANKILFPLREALNEAIKVNVLALVICYVLLALGSFIVSKLVYSPANMLNKSNFSEFYFSTPAYKTAIINYYNNQASVNNATYENK